MAEKRYSIRFLTYHVIYDLVEQDDLIPYLVFTNAVLAGSQFINLGSFQEFDICNCTITIILTIRSFIICSHQITAAWLTWTRRLFDLKVPTDNEKTNSNHQNGLEQLHPICHLPLAIINYWMMCRIFAGMASTCAILILTPSVTNCVLIIWATFSINFGVFALLSVCGTHLDIISTIVTLLSIGYSVDYSSHILAHFYHFKRHSKDPIGNWFLQALKFF